MDRERKREGRHNQSPPRAASSTTRRPLKLPQIRNAKSQIPNPKAFTLIELLVVIAVIALLMAILLPVLGRVRSQGRAVVCQANLRQWGMTLALYVENHQGELPYSSGFGIGSVWLLRGVVVSDDAPDAPQDSLHHFQTQGIACCPMAAKPVVRDPYTFNWPAHFGGNVSAYIEGTSGSTFKAWQITSPGSPFRGSYAPNADLFSRFPWPSRTAGRRGPNVFRLRGRDSRPVLLDCAIPWCDPHERDRPPRTEFRTGEFSPDMDGVCINRHNAHVNGLFLDWSARKVGLKELWTLEWHEEFDTGGPWTIAGGVKPSDWPKWMRHFRDY